MSLVTTVSLPAVCGVNVPAAGEVDLSPQAARSRTAAKQHPHRAPEPRAYRLTISLTKIELVPLTEPIWIAFVAVATARSNDRNCGGMPQGSTCSTGAARREAV